jgi:hypothetical protein
MDTEQQATISESQRINRLIVVWACKWQLAHQYYQHTVGWFLGSLPACCVDGGFTRWFSAIRFLFVSFSGQVICKTLQPHVETPFICLTCMHHFVWEICKAPTLLFQSLLTSFFMWRRVNDGEIGHCESRNSCSQTQPVDGELENVCTLLPHYLIPVPPGSMTHDAFNAVLFSFFLIIICFSWDSAEARSYGCTQILATSANVLSKYGDFRVFFLKMWLLWFFPKEILIFVLALQCGKFRQKEFE